MNWGILARRFVIHLWSSPFREGTSVPKYYASIDSCSMHSFGGTGWIGVVARFSGTGWSDLFANGIGFSNFIDGNG